MKEIWKDIEGFEGLYQVSNMGNIKSFHKFYKNFKKPKKVKNIKILKQYKDRKGYMTTQLSKKGFRYTVKVHRIVAMAFIPNPCSKQQVNHINCDKMDNNVNNLEWVTNDENKKHAKKHNLCKSSPKGSKNSRAKKVNQYDLNGKLINRWGSLMDILREFNLKSVSNISSCCKQRIITGKNGKKYKTKTAYGYIWEYDEE